MTKYFNLKKGIEPNTTYTIKELDEMVLVDTTKWGATRWGDYFKMMEIQGREEGFQPYFDLYSGTSLVLNLPTKAFLRRKTDVRKRVLNAKWL